MPLPPSHSTHHSYSRQQPRAARHEPSEYDRRPPCDSSVPAPPSSSSWSPRKPSAGPSVHRSRDESCARVKRVRARRCADLPLEWWSRADDCRTAKEDHMDRVDGICDSREDLVLKTTLWKEPTVLESNMFPYSTPRGIEHYTLWSIYDLSHREILEFVDDWLARHMPHVRRWQYDDNSGDRSIDLFHVHVFIETIPYSFTPRPDREYFPPHARRSSDGFRSS